jgi:hypothetical protein
MGAQDKAASDLLKKQEANLDSLNSELALDLAQSAVDIAGIADPTPISDAIGAGMSLYRGDLIGAGLSLVSMVPYAGDALGKTAKGARLAKKIAGLKKKISAAIAAVKKARAAKLAAKKKAAAALRAKRKADKAKKFAEAKKCKGCKPPSGNKFGSRSPTEGSNGSWKGGEPGDSKWHPDPNTEKGQKVLDATGGKPVEFKNGYPDFSPHAMKLPDGSKATFEIDMTGKSSDFTKARDAMRKKLGDPSWPGGGPNKKAPKGWTWHHNEDGVTMELVPSNLNNNIPHTGGDSLARELAGDPGF